MAANSAVTEPHVKKPKLDLGYGDNEEAEMMETLEPDYDSDFEAMSLGKQLFGELLSELCKSALAHYQDEHEHQGESYEFESLLGGQQWCNRSNQYLLEFCAKNLRAEGSPLQNFKAYLFYHSLDGSKEFVVHNCVLLEDDGMQSMDPEDLFVTEPHLKKPKMDDKLGMVENLESVEREMSTESDDGDKEVVDTSERYLGDGSDIDRLIEKGGRIRPEHFESGEESEELVAFCKAAIAYFQRKHPEESYEFVSGHGGFRWFNNFRHNEYRLEFSAKSLRENGNPIRNFEAYVDYHPYDGPEESVVEECVQWKDDEVEPKFDKDYEPETPLEDLDENESARIIELCKSSLDFYKDNHEEESYEFVKMQKVKRWIAHGVEYILVFHAKNLKLDTLATFKAKAYHLKRVFEGVRCEIISD